MREDWAEQLALWLGPLDAITLHAARQPVRAPTPRRSVGGRAAISLEADLRRARDGLLHAMAQQVGVVKARVAGSDARSAESAEVDFATYRQRYQEQQRRMEMMLEPLRSHCRGVLTQANSDLHQLAELDAAMEQVLGEREKALLSRLPHWLERRFAQRKKAATLAEEAGVGAAEQGPQAWLACFEQDCQQLLLAELAFRLEPIEGLAQAFHNKAMQT